MSQEDIEDNMNGLPLYSPSTGSKGKPKKKSKSPAKAASKTPVRAVAKPPARAMHKAPAHKAPQKKMLRRRG